MSIVELINDIPFERLNKASHNRGHRFFCSVQSIVIFQVFIYAIVVDRIGFDNNLSFKIFELMSGHDEP